MGIRVMSRQLDYAILGIDSAGPDIAGFSIAGKLLTESSYVPLSLFSPYIVNVDGSFVGPSELAIRYSGKVTVHLSMANLGQLANTHPYYVQLSVISTSGVSTAVDETIIYPYGVSSRSSVDAPDNVALMYTWSEDDQKWHKALGAVDGITVVRAKVDTEMDVYNIEVPPGDAVQFDFPQTLNSALVLPMTGIYIHFSKPAQNDLDPQPSIPVQAGGNFKLDNFLLTKISIKLASSSTESTTVSVIGAW